MTASDLKPSNTFSLTKRKNAKKFTVSSTCDKAIDVIGGPSYRNPPKDQIGKLLIILNGCGQLVLDPKQEIFLH